MNWFHLIVFLHYFYHGNLEQNICIYFLLNWYILWNFLFTGDILQRKSDHREVSGNRNGTATTYFFGWQWFTYLASLYNPATSEAITNWVRYSTNAILRLASTLLSFSTSKAKRWSNRYLFSWEKIPPLYERLMLWSTNQTSFHLKAAFSKIFDGWSSFSYL